MYIMYLIEYFTLHIYILLYTKTTTLPANDSRFARFASENLKVLLLISTFLGSLERYFHFYRILSFFSGLSFPLFLVFLIVQLRCTLKQKVNRKSVFILKGVVEVFNLFRPELFPPSQIKAGQQERGHFFFFFLYVLRFIRRLREFLKSRTKKSTSFQFSKIASWRIKIYFDPENDP